MRSCPPYAPIGRRSRMGRFRALPAAVIFVLVAAASTGRAAIGQPRPDGPQPTAIVPFELIGNQIWLSGRVNGSRPLHYLLDTAATGCSLNRPLVDELRLRVVREFEQPNAGTGNGQARIAVIGAAALDLGPTALAIDRLFAVDYDEVARGFGEPIDGVLGLALLQRHVVRIDYDAGTLTLFEPRSFAAAPPVGTVVPLDIDANGMARVKVRMTVPGVGVLAGLFLIDSAYPGTVLCTTPFSRRNAVVQRLRTANRTIQMDAVAGVAGRHSIIVTRGHSLDLGGHVVEQPTAAFTFDATGGAMARRDIAGILGTEILRRFRVTLDFPARRMILEPGKQFADPVESDASGLSIRTMLRAYRDFEVFRVRRGTPASKAHLAPGDRILQIDGQPADAWSLAHLRLALRQPDIEHEFVLQRDEKTFTVRLRTRRQM